MTRVVQPSALAASAAPLATPVCPPLRKSPATITTALPGVPAGPEVGPSQLPDFSVAAFTVALAWSRNASARATGGPTASASRLLISRLEVSRIIQLSLG